ncbi:MAG: metallophosphoesterase family protein, partial [Raoultibacter sp.]
MLLQQAVSWCLADGRARLKHTATGSFNLFEGCEQVNSAVKTVGILSDTHGRLPVAVFAALEECDYLIHAGDIGAPRILRELETIA